MVKGTLLSRAFVSQFRRRLVHTQAAGSRQCSTILLSSHDAISYGEEDHHGCFEFLPQWCSKYKRHSHNFVMNTESSHVLPTSRPVMPGSFANYIVKRRRRFLLSPRDNQSM
uniref:Uncharacterized protein n=1 Tax=Guillardia theta TaxID=55529 RepID=A0A7S4KQ34_GUITH